MAEQISHSLRSDAQRNRDHILSVARAAFREGGLDVTMRDVARRSGVGVATLYRRFPTKEALITEAFTETMEHCQTIVDNALKDPDPWQGLCTVIEAVCVIQALDRGFTPAFMTTFPDAMDFTARRDQTLRKAAQLIQHAKAVGALREDCELGDLAVIIMAVAGIMTTSPKAAVAAARRFAALQMQALQRTPSNVTLPPPGQLVLPPLPTPKKSRGRTPQHS